MNDWEIPELLRSMCAERLIAPVTKWGTRGRTLPMPGTYHFYTHDYKWSGQRCRPGMVADTGCRVAVEPNFSTHEDMPDYEILWLTAQKRIYARAWQEAGIRVIVDLNVARKAREINLIGVPEGWTAYATRAHKGVPFSALYEEYLIARDHAGTEEILFCVFGGGRRIKEPCRHNGWAWVPEHRQVVAGLEKAYEDG